MPKPESAQDKAERLRIERLQKFADALVAKRKDAIDGRALTGMEKILTEDEEFYDSIDDLNRAEMLGTQMEKGTTLSGGLTSEPKEPSAVRSTIFVNIVQTYVDMAAAAIADMLLPTDDMPFGIQPTPEPDIEATAKAKDPTVFMHPDGTSKTAGQIADDMIAEAKASATKVETRIWDWLTESNWHAEVRKVIDEAAKTGTSILKGPIPLEQKKKAISRDPDTGSVLIKMVSKVKPGSKQISTKNFYPDPACGENIQNGSYVWEKDTLTARQLRKMAEQRDKDGELFYLPGQIRKVLLEGPDKKYADGQKQRDQTAEGEKYTIWYYYGAATAEDMAAAGCKCDEMDVVPVFVTMVNDTVIKATVSTLDSGEFPYDVLVWQRIPGKWWGKGEGRKLRHCQKMLNGAVRNMMDNAGLSSGPQIILDLDVLEPADGVLGITPRKLWRKITNVDLPAGGIKEAITSINIESLQQELMNIVEFAIGMADKIATMPIQQQGQQGALQETAEGRRLLQNNAGVTKRRLAKLFDDRITEPHVGRYHEWLLLYDDDPELKRDMVIDAVGSSALYERDAQNIFITQMAGLVKDPAYDLSPKQWMQEMLKGQKLDPKRFKPTDEEREAMANQQPPVDPRIEAAKITAESREKVAAMDTDRDTVYVEAQAQRDLQQAQYLERKRADEYRLGILKYATQRNITLDNAKKELAKVAMTLHSQEKLAMSATSAAPQVARSRAEPPKRAKPGKAFQE